MTEPKVPDEASTLDEPTTADRLKAIEERLVAGDTRMNDFENKLSENTAATLATNAITADIKDILTAAKVGLKVIGAIGTIAKWIGLIATAVVAIYGAIYAVKSGGVPPPPN